MAAVIRVVRVSCITSGGPTQDITHPDIGASSKMKAAIFLRNFATADNTPVAVAHWSLGWTDGTAQQCLSGFAADQNPSQTSAARGMYEDALTAFIDSSARQSYATFDSWIAGGVRINWATLPGTAQKMTVVLLWGDDILAKVTDAMTPATAGSGGTVDHADVGFEAQVVFAMSQNTGGFQSAGSVFNDDETSIGIATNFSGTIAQRSYFRMWRGQPTTTSNGAASLHDDGIHLDMFNVTVIQTTFLKDFDASGFSLECSGSTINARPLGLLSLRFLNGMRAHLGDFTSPTAAEDKVVAVAGLNSQAGFVLQSLLQTKNADVATGDAGATSLGFFDKTTSGCHSTQEEDGVATASADTQSITDAKVVNSQLHNLAAGLVASLVSLKDGITLNYSAVPANARQAILLLFEEEPLPKGDVKQVYGTSPLAQVVARI